MELYAEVVHFFQQGGVFMALISLVLAGGAAIAIERYAFLIRAQRSNTKAWTRVYPQIAAARYAEAEEMLARNRGGLQLVLSRGLSAIRRNHNRKQVEIAIEEGLMEVIPAIEKRTHYLAAFANIATLLGLLGTIIGLTRAFSAISAADAAEKAALLSSSISLAMNTTAYGLIVAIPLLLSYTYLHTKTTEAIDTLEVAAIKFVNVITNASEQEEEIR